MNRKEITIVTALGAVSLIAALLLFQEASRISERVFAATAKAEKIDRAPLRKKAVLLEAGLGKENELQSCYQTFLRTEPRVDEGIVEMHWMLDARGKVTSMQMVNSDLDDPAFKDCLLEKMRKMTFKAPPKSRPTLVAHKFKFHKRTPGNLDFKTAREAAED